VASRILTLCTRPELPDRTESLRQNIQRKQSARVPLASRIHKPPTLRDLGFMINVDADHSVKLTLSWFEPGFCRWTFAFFRSSPARVVKVFGSK